MDYNKLREAFKNLMMWVPDLRTKVSEEESDLISKFLYQNENPVINEEEEFVKIKIVDTFNKKTQYFLIKESEWEVEYIDWPSEFSIPNTQARMKCNLYDVETKEFVTTYSVPYCVHEDFVHRKQWLYVEE